MSWLLFLINLLCPYWIIKISKELYIYVWLFNDLLFVILTLIYPSSEVFLCNRKH